RFDLLVTPALPIPAFEAGHDVPPGSSHREWTGWTPFSYPFNLTQQPAASVPCGFTSDGLPIGLQVVGPRHADATVLAACHAYERARSLSAAASLSRRSHRSRRCHRVGRHTHVPAGSPRSSSPPRTRPHRPPGSRAAGPSAIAAS